MTTQYTSILKLALPVQGELSGTWGDVVNDNITSMVEEAIAGRAVIDSWTTNSHTLTSANGTTSESRCAMLEFTDTGTALTGDATVVCPTAAKIYICKNDAGQKVTIKTSAGTGVAIADGQTMFVFCDGTNVVEAVTSMSSLKLGTAVTSIEVTSILDEDDLVSDSATALATQQSIKAYVDAQVTAQDLDFGGDSGTGSVDLDSQSLTIAGTSNEIETSAADQTLTIGLPDAVTVTTSVTTPTVQTTNLNANDGTAAVTIADSTGQTTITDAVLTTADINGGTADNVVIGGTTAAAGSFTTVGATGNITSEGQVITDTINEQTATSGVTVDGVLLKDGGATLTGDLTVDTDTLYVDSTNDRVGIGTSSPASYGLSVEKSASTATGMNIRNVNTGSSAYAGIYFGGATSETDVFLGAVGDNTTTYGGGRSALFGTNASTPTVLITGGTERMRITSSGSVGIGTSSPLSILDVKNATNEHIVVSGSSTYGNNAIVGVNDSGGEVGLGLGGNTVEFYTAATERMRIDSSGNVGIGTDSPSRNLEVYGSVTPRISIVSGNTSTGSSALLFGDTDADNIGSINYAHVDNSMRFSTSSSEAMRIDSSGNLLVGRSSNLAGARTLVTGTKSGTNGTNGLLVVLDEQSYSTTDNGGGISFAGNFYDGGQVVFATVQGVKENNTDANDAGALKFTTKANGANQVEAMRIKSSGNVSIGDSNSVTGLRYFDIYNTGSTSTDGAILRLISQQVGSTSTTSADIVKRKNGEFRISNFETNSAAYMAFNVGPTERIRITSSGQFLIGTSTGTVYYNSVNTYNASAVIKTNTSNEIAELVITNGNNNFGSAVEFARTNTAGNDVRFASISALPTNTTAGTEAGAIRFYTKDTTDSNIVERMRLLSNGNFGIGTSTPTHRLDILNDGGEQLRILAWDQSTTARANVDFWYLDAGGSAYNNAQISTQAAANAGNGSLVFSTRPTSGSLTERVKITANGSLVVRGNNTDSGHYLQVGEFDTAASSQSDGEIKLIHVDDSYVMRVARESGSGDVASTGWYSVAKIPPFGSAGKVTVSLGGDFTADIVVIEWISSHNTALGNSLAEPELRAKATFANVTSPRISNTRIARDSSTGAYYVQVYISSGVNNNTKGKSLLEVYPGRYVETDDGNIQAMFTLFSGSTSHSFECPITTNGSTRTGRQSAPQQPAFHATSGADQTSDGVVSFTSWVSNVGSYYNSSTNRFTAPVAGTYKFSARIMKIASSGRSTVDFAFRKNGAGIGNNLYDTSAGSLEYGSGTINLIAVLAAGDYITVYTSSTTSTNKLHANHREFTGYLIG